MGVLETSRINDKIMFLELACPYTNEIIAIISGGKNQML